MSFGFLCYSVSTALFFGAANCNSWGLLLAQNDEKKQAFFEPYLLIFFK